MGYQSIFQRYELKYLISRDKKDLISEIIAERAVADEYGASTVRNLYFDTDSYRLIRDSIEKPIYKEKLRLRSYRRAVGDADVFVELKKKYKGVVYKRRLALPEGAAIGWLTGNTPMPCDSQIAREIEYFKNFYGTLLPRAYLSYEREAFYLKEDPSVRITFDENVLYRDQDLTLDSKPWGDAVLPSGQTLMEIKCSGGMPMWLSHMLSKEKIYKTSFSKYGEAYKKYILDNQRRYNNHGVLV